MAVDAAGSFDGMYTPGAGAITYTVDTGIPHETNKAVSVTGKSHVQIPWALELNPQGPFTAELWFMPASMSPEYRDVFSSEGAGPGWSGPNGWLLYQQPNNELVWVLFSRSWNAAWLAGGGVLEVNTWYHAVLTYDGALFRSFNGDLWATQVTTPSSRTETVGPAWDSVSMEAAAGSMVSLTMSPSITRR